VSIEKDGASFIPVDISDLFAVEVDFPEDLERANEGVKD
jgi:choline kinase